MKRNLLEPDSLRPHVIVVTFRVVCVLGRRRNGSYQRLNHITGSRVWRSCFVRVHHWCCDLLLFLGVLSLMLVALRRRGLSFPVLVLSVARTSVHRYVHPCRTSPDLLPHQSWLHGPLRSPSTRCLTSYNLGASLPVGSIDVAGCCCCCAIVLTTSCVPLTVAPPTSGSTPAPISSAPV